MPKQQITIEVDVPEGYEVVRYGTPLDGDYVLTVNGVCREYGIHMQGQQRLVLCPAWQWPTWLKFDYIAMDENGEWWAYENEPDIFDSEMWYAGGNKLEIDQRGIAFTPPPCTDWRKSKRRRPT